MSIRVSDEQFHSDTSSDTNSDPDSQNSPNTFRSRSPILKSKNKIINATSKKQNIKMEGATVPILKKEYLNMLPDFEGQQELLPRFIEIAEKLVNKFYNANDPNDFQNEYLMSSIMAKIKGKAAINIVSSTINSWQELKTALLNSYADKRDLYTLNIEISQFKQINETAFEFYNKVQKHLNLQLAYIASHSNALESAILSQYVKQLALRVLLRGLKDPLGNLMRTKNPPDMNTALNMLTNDFQLESLENRINKNIQINKSPQKHPNYSKPFQTTNFPHNTQFKQTHTPQFNYQFKQKLPNMTHTTNVFRPNQRQNLPKPTPMSVSTSYTQNYQQNRNAKQTKFTPMELNNYRDDILEEQEPMIEYPVDENLEVNDQDEIINEPSLSEFFPEVASEENPNFS